MLLRQNPRGQRIGRVIGQNWHVRLSKDGALIKLCGDLMHGTSGLGLARLKRAGMGVKATIFRQKRGVDV